MEEDPSDIFGLGALPNEANFFVDILGNDMSLHWPMLTQELPQGTSSGDAQNASDSPGCALEVPEVLFDNEASWHAPDATPSRLIEPPPAPALYQADNLGPSEPPMIKTEIGLAEESELEPVSSLAPQDMVFALPKMVPRPARESSESGIESAVQTVLEELLEIVVRDMSKFRPSSERSLRDEQQQLDERAPRRLEVPRLDPSLDEESETIAKELLEILVEETCQSQIEDQICRRHIDGPVPLSINTVPESPAEEAPENGRIVKLSDAKDAPEQVDKDSTKPVYGAPPNAVSQATATPERSLLRDAINEPIAATPAPSESATTEGLALEQECACCETALRMCEEVFDSQITPLSTSPSPSVCTASVMPEPGPWTDVRQQNFAVELPSSTLVSPPSYYEPFTPPTPELAEWRIVDALCRENRRLGRLKDGYMEFDLNDFAVYIDGAHYPNEMRSLHFLDTRPGHSKYYFDGTLSVGELSYFVRRVAIAALPIEGYTDPEVHTVQGSTWLHSTHNAKRQLYYKLCKPAKEYARFYEPFVWVADLAKHVVDFLDAMEAQKEKVSIHSFKDNFSAWLLRRHGSDGDFLRWGRQHPSADFRTSIAAHVGFLYKEAYGVLGPGRVDFHPLWDEIMRFSRFKREPTANVRHDPTIVTEYIRDCFSHLPFGDRLESIPFGENTKRLRRKLIRKRRLEMPAPLHDGAADLSIADRNRTRKVKPGDTISTLRDDVGSGTKWKREVSMGSLDVDRWFARVQKVSKTRRGQRVFDVIWYYRPEDTLCGLMKYPWSNELFLSDHCSCEEASKITEDQILGVHDVDFWGTSATQQELFCRQTYISGDRKWITLEKKHLYCDHVCYDGAADEPNYRVGDTVLLSLKSRSDRSEPCEIVELEGHSKKIRIRQLLRRRDVDASASLSPPNELVWSDKLVYSKRSRILSACHIRFFRSGTEIPTPYNRGGVGAFYFITHKHLADGSCKPLTEQPPSLRQGFDPYQELPRLRGLDLFCGGGNFGRGLEDGNAIEMRWLNDYNEQAVHTYMANVPNPEAVHPFLGSIDDLQRQAMLGNFSDKVPKIGEVDFISAGSPCPGFSNLTNDKTTAQQRKNQSLVAAFGSFVDLYRPQYGLLENVRGIVQKKANRDQDVFSQLICAVVGLGYQTRFFFLDASSCGSPQARPRVFLAFAAPGCRLPNKPQITHSHPPTAKSLSLGLLPNGEAMAEREMPDATPFKFVSAAEACDDLPRIYDAKPDTCIPYPDHRVAIGTTRDIRLQMSAIPTQPWGMNFAMAWYGMDKKKAGSGVFTQADRDLFPADEGKRTMGRTLANSSAYGRMHPHRPLNTIVTRQSPGDAKAGQQLHWREPRAITLMEARRAQGFRDHEVLLGSVRAQYKIVGNSVAREVAVALGLMFREAEFGSLTDGEEDLSRLMGVDLTDEAECSDDEEVDLSDCPVSRMTSSSSRTSTMTSSQRSTPATTVKRSNSPLSIVVEIPSAKRQRYDRAVSGRAYWKAQASPLRRASDTVAVDELA